MEALKSGKREPYAGDTETPEQHIPASRLDIHRITFVLDRHCTLPPPCIGRQKNETEDGKQLRSYESGEGYFHKWD
jgi:hypothetical protein